MVKKGWAKNQYLIDGFPRNQENLDVFKKIFGDKVDIKFILFYECSFETMEKRILERAKTSGRSDDNPEALKKRFDTYLKETQPVVDYYDKLGLTRKINAERSVEEVYADTQKVLDTVREVFTNIVNLFSHHFFIYLGQEARSSLYYRRSRLWKRNSMRKNH